MTGSLSTINLSAQGIFLQGRTRITSRNATNIFIGDYSTGNNNATGNHNFIFGLSAGNALTSGASNVFIGSCAGRVNTTGANNNFLGYRAGYNNTTGSSNNFLGRYAGSCIGKYGAANHNVFIGKEAGRGYYCSSYTPTTVFVNNNVAIGYRAGYKLKAHTYNTYYHYATQHNIFIGERAGYNSSTDNSYGAARYNNFLGRQAGFCNTTGSNNNFLGTTAGFYNTYGTSNNFFGANAGRSNTTGGYNNFLGRQAGFCNTTGSFNNFLGVGAGFCNTTGNYNNFFGRYAGRFNTTGRYNNFIGRFAGFCNTYGTSNNFFGANAGRYNTTGSNNNFFGRYAGCTNTIGSNNTIIGNAANVVTNSLSGVIILGTGAIATQSNQLVLGSLSNPLTGNSILYGNLSIQTNTTALSTRDGTSDQWNSTSLAFAASDESSNVTTGNNKILFTIPYNFVLTKVKGGLNRAATGSSLIFSLSSQTNNNTAATITIPANNLFADSSALTYNLNENDRMCINITQVGSTQPGIGLKIYLIGRFK